MANVYVSQTATNDYAVGNDSNDGSTKALAKLTITSAWGAMSSNDVMIINDGTYDESSYLFMSGKTGCSITAENDHLVTWTNQTVEGRIFHFDESTSPITMGKLIIDGEDAQTSCFTLDTAPVTPGTAIFDGTWFRNATTYVLSSSKVGTLTFQNGARLENSPRFLNLLQTANDATYNFTDTTFINSDEITLGANPIRIVPTSATGLTVNMTNVTASVARPAGDTNTARQMFEFGGVATINIENYTFSYTNTTTESMGGMVIIPHATLTTNRVRINGITSGSSATTKQSYGLIIGSEIATNANRINDVKVTNCTVTNCNHGIMFGFITSAEAYGNSATDSDLGFNCKGTTTCTVAGNFTKDIATYAYLGKFDAGSTFANNTHITESTAATIGVCATQDNEGSNPSVNTNYYNNNIYDALGTQTLLYCENDSSTANYYNNNVYQPNGNTNNRFVYQATDTDVLATWDTAVNVANTASGNTEVDPLLTDYTNGDYSLTSASTLVGGGTAWHTGAGPITRGDPIPATGIDVGGFQSGFGPFHPKNL